MAAGTEPTGNQAGGTGQNASTNPVGVDDYIPADDETPFETARKIAHLLDADENTGNDGEESQETPEQESTQGDTAPGVQEVTTPHQEAQKQAANQLNQADDKATNDPELLPPAILQAEHKKAFLNLPDNFKREANRIFKAIQGFGTRKQQELQKSLEQSEGIISNASRYIQDNNVIDPQTKQYYTPQRLFTELMQAHNSINRDPDRAIANMIMNTGANPENIALYLQGKNPTGFDVKADPQFTALQNQVMQLQNQLAERERAEQQQKSAPAVQEYSTVFQEIDPNTGEYKYPELHDQQFLEATGPIVAALLRTGRYSPAQALKQAWTTLTGKPHSVSSGTQQITTQNQQINYKERARNAAVSVRGRIPPAGSDKDVSDDLELDEIPDSPTETARLIARRLAGG